MTPQAFLDKIKADALVASIAASQVIDLARYKDAKKAQRRARQECRGHLQGGRA